MVNSTDILNALILIVDDLKANIGILKRTLVSAGHTSVTSTTNPFEVCGLHRMHRYDLILLDLLMPGMDGFQVMEELNEIEPNKQRVMFGFSARRFVSAVPTSPPYTPTQNLTLPKKLHAASRILKVPPNHGSERNALHGLI